MTYYINIINYKQRLRKIFLAKRKNLAQNKAESLAQQASKLLIASKIWQNAQSVCLYMPIKAEITCSYLLADAQKNKTILLPRCHTEPKNYTAKNPVNYLGLMDFVEYTCENDLVLGKYNILEPQQSLAKSEIIPDLILVPALVYDRRGYRIGYGGGYYDRLLADKKYSHSLALGFAYDFQLCTKLLHEDHDIQLKALCTNQELIIF